MSRHKRLLTVAPIAVIVLAAALIGSFLLTTTVTDAVTAANRANKAVSEIQADRVERIKVRCTQDHANYLANLEQLNLIRDLLHQTDPNDPRITPAQRSLFRESLAKAEARIAQSKALLDATDCTQPVLPKS